MHGVCARIIPTASSTPAGGRQPKGRVTIRIVAADTTGMANHITETVIRDLKLNIRSMNLASRGGLLTGTVDVEVPATSVVDTLVHAILRIKGVQKAFRTNG